MSLKDEQDAALKAMGEELDSNGMTITSVSDGWVLMLTEAKLEEFLIRARKDGKVLILIRSPQTPQFVDTSNLN